MIESQGQFEVRTRTNAPCKHALLLGFPMTDWATAAAASERKRSLSANFDSKASKQTHTTATSAATPK